MRAFFGSMFVASLVACSAPPAPTGCTTNADCAKSSTGHVCSVGQCVACATAADCSGGKKCNNGACVDCVMAGDCSAGQKCVASACVAGCDAKDPCPSGQVCDPTLGACVACSSSSDCKAPTGVCDTSSHTCVGCTVDGDCMAGSVCVDKSCAAGCNGSHPQCPAGKLCSVAKGACVDCLADGDCQSSGTWCASGTCVPGCRGDADCASQGQQCDLVKHACVACVSDSNCGFGQVCQVSSETCVAGCNPNHPCPSGQGCCNGACVAIATDPSNCGGCGISCGASGGCCGGVCVPVNTVANCGACGNACGNVVNGVSACTAGKCAIGGCDGTYLNCDGNPATGCNIQGATDAKNCGKCGNVCGAVQNGSGACQAGACTITACNGSFKNCSGKYGDGCNVDTSSDASNCGACGNACPTGAPCVGGLCTAVSCNQLKQANSSLPSGLYTIDVDGPSGPLQPFKAYCDMTTLGGGWTLVLHVYLSNNFPIPGSAQSWTAWKAIGIGSPNAYTSISDSSYYVMPLETWRVLSGQSTSLRFQSDNNPSVATITGYAMNTNYGLQGNNLPAVEQAMCTSYATSNCFLRAPGFSTYDVRNDNYSNSTPCTSYTSNTAWWFDDCWSTDVFFVANSQVFAGYTADPTTQHWSWWVK